MNILAAGAARCIRVSGRAAHTTGAAAPRLVRILLRGGLGGRRAPQAQPQGRVHHVQPAPLHSPQRQVAAAVHALAHLVPGAAQVHSVCAACVGEQQGEQLYRTMRAAHGSDTNFSLADALQRICKALLSEIIRTRRADEFRWPHQRKHPAFERLRRAGTFLPARSCLQASQRRI